MEEIWKDIVGYEGMYQVSNRKRVKSLSRIVKRNDGKIRTISERILKQSVANGYLNVGLSKNAKLKTYTVHRLVAIAFIPNPDNLPMINHLDGDKTNNYVSNLEWCTGRENSLHAIRNGLFVAPNGINHYRATIKNQEIVDEIKEKHKIYQDAKKYSINNLSKHYGVSRNVIRSILRYK